MHAKPPLLPIVHWRAPRFLAIAIVIAFVASLVLQPWFSPQLLMLVSWDVGALCYVGLGWLVIARTDETQTRQRAQRYDPSGYVIFLLVVIAASVSFVAIGFMVGDIKELSFWARAERLTLSITALFVSWVLIHTVFAFHYARLYYFQPDGRGKHHGGLKFPHDNEPDYFDFAYYSFVVGMTCQVSDVAVLSRQMRRQTMIHGVLSFVYNIAILAMSINIIGGVI